MDTRYLDEKEETEAAQKRILVVDDDPSLCDSLKMLFELEGFEVDLASSGHQALELVNEHKVDFILSDVRMANGTGLELLERLRMENNRTPFVFMTGFAGLSRNEAIERGATDLLIKPFHFDDIIRLVGESGYAPCTEG